ncbi:PQQ-binding-like beta-propeller repeat protein [Oceanicola sp. 502str15]|uniref:outer membrane protein assembly factor BamB family protein n=1 Tax=Oceanicola sp. 502str15 TaxID=2696061 RepID=UPI0020944145|nr:PQQ-binding-like beta-propeller repeat protein [Oceanicola sp. 502str15]MCO6384020.1 PQQ-binding-like beta-propeller repeat protein [Oceanicola sp. 502str15]
MKRIVAALALSTTLALPAAANLPSGGLGGFSLSPDGATLLAGGDNRVIYVIDAATFEVKERIWSPAMPVWMDHSADGSLVYVLDSDDMLTAYAAADMSKKWEIQRVRDMAFRPEANRIVTWRGVSGGSEITVIDATTGGQQKTVATPEGTQIDSAGLSDDGTMLYAITRQEKSEDETKEKPGDDVKGLDKEIFRKKHDGYVAQLLKVDLEAGTTAATGSWYSGSNFDDVRAVGEQVFYLKPGSDPMVADAAGEVTMLDLQRTNGDYAEISPDGTEIVAGDGGKVSFIPVAGGAPLTLGVEDLPGWFEKTQGFEYLPDGRVVAVTDGWRLVVIDRAAGTATAYPVY